MEANTDIRVIFITAESFENARQIARILVSEKLAACCTLVPNCISIYEWEDKLEEAYEFLMIIKSQKDKIQSLQERVEELHSYGAPEIIALSVTDLSEKYLEWINNVLK